MKDLVQDLLDHLSLERIEENLFRGESRDIGGRSVFGGQVLGQALTAARRTVEGREAHSLHAYFLRPGDMDAPIIYEVERIRDGRSFTTRRVVAIQHGQAIFNLSASFQTREEGVEHQAQMPQVPGPEGLANKTELGRRAAQQAPEEVRGFLTRERPVELRPVQPVDLLNPDAPRNGRFGCGFPGRCRICRRFTRRCWLTLRIFPCSVPPCSRMASPFYNVRCRRRALITPCGFTGISASTSGCCTSWTARAPPMRGG